MRFNIDIDFKVSKFIRRFIIADTILFGGWGFVDPIFSVFIIQRIPGASLVTVGFTVAIYWILKSIIQIPIALFLDKTDGERDDFYALIFGLAIVGVGAIATTLATTVWHIYVLQVIKAIGFAMYIASWPVLFSRHLDKGHYSLDWSMDSTSVGVAIGISGFLAGILVTWLGYNSVFLAAGICSLGSAGILLSAPSLGFPPPLRRTKPVFKDHVPIDVNQ